ncbi:MAG: 23S rRNA (guanosine(2251)-2'-O)-methyltransferase RlmB [Chloroflexi bacterium RBG_19FT_COMBO_50_10]|nr:MAG: 23S rRNA (guanosine(2251)-2'-O)-methyltransferase RlmB [Chloroflexi bacterium RBG_19FT_COMBO_50_10]
MKEWLYGRNAVYETMRARKRHFFRLRLAQGGEEKGTLIEIMRMASDFKLPVERVPRTSLEALAKGHQGVALETSSYPYSDLADILALAARRNEPAYLLILDVIQDPQNLGTLIRTAEGVGVHGVLLPFRHTASITPAVVNASSGACEHLLVTQVNLAQAIQQLKEENIWIVGLEAGLEAQSLQKVRLDGPLALVIGGEGGGMRALVRKSCDVLMRLPMRGKVESLNAAVAGSVALYFAWQGRGFGNQSIDDLTNP